MSDTMNAIVCTRYAPPDALEYQAVPVPTLGKGDVRIAVHAAGVNFPDTLIIEGKYQFKPEPPFSPGGEVAGVVAEVGEQVKHLKPGDHVAALVLHGGYAEQVVVPAAMVLPVPASIPLDVAASFSMTYGTSYHALKQRAALQAGETLLVLGAAGGVGLAAVQIGKAMGARVIAAAGSDDKLALCREHGADDTINYATEDLKARAKDLTGGQGADVIYDPVGGDFFRPALSAIAWKGRYLVVGFAAGEIPQVGINRLLLKGAALVGVFWGVFAQREGDANRQNFMELFELMQQGKITPHISARYPLKDAPEALNAMLQRKITGKAVLLTDAFDG